MLGYKLARPDGWDFYTGKTINYRGDGVYPHIVRVPKPNAALGVCSAGVGHASTNPNDCFVGAQIPCSCYLLDFEPVCGNPQKWGWIEARVLEEIPQESLDNLFGWRYSEACHPLNPLLVLAGSPTAEDSALLRAWDSVWASVRDSVWASVEDSVWASVRDSVWASVRDSVWASVEDSVWDSVRAYIGTLFPSISQWKYISDSVGGYPFQSSVELWRKGFVPSFDGKTWRLHAGPTAQIVLEVDQDRLRNHE